MRLLVTRPAEEAAALARRLVALGHVPIIEPLLQVRAITGATPPMEGVAALLFTSTNGVRAFAAASPRRDLPAYAVGDRTAAAAEDAGFARTESAQGNAASLARLVAARRRPEDGVLLHAAGTDLAGDLAGALQRDGFEVRVVALYETVPVASFTDNARRSIAQGTLDGVLLLSPRTARHFATLARAAALERAARNLVVWCLSQPVADALAPLRVKRIHVAAQPTQESLLGALVDAARHRGDPEPGGRSPDRHAHP